MSKKINKPCAHPTIRTFSYEAMGIDVSALVKEVFGIDLLWYKKRILPAYTCVVAGLLTNMEMVESKVIMRLKEIE